MAAAAAAVETLISSVTVCLTFRYENFDIAYGACLLHIWNGSCSFQSERLTTHWHGLYRPGLCARYDLRFNCEGRLDRIKSLTVWRHSPTLFQGYDYAIRRIRMTLIRVQHWDPERQVWFEVALPGEQLALNDEADWERI